MNSATPPPEPGPGEAPPQPAPRKKTGVRWALGALLTVTALVGAGVSWRIWLAPGDPAPPEIPLAGVERATAALLEQEQEKVREQPRSASAWGRLGQVLLVHSFQPQALTCLARAEELDPREPRWPYLQGMALLSEEPERAQPHLRRAVELCDRHEPSQVTPRLQLAEVLLALGQYPEAEEQLKAIARQEPRNTRLQYESGMLAFQRDDLVAAVNYLTPLRNDPSARQKSAACLAQIHQRLNNPGRATEYSRLARQLPRDTPWPDDYMSECLELATARTAVLGKVQALDNPNQLRAAVPELERMAREDEQGAGATNLVLATTLARLGRYREAEAKLRLLLRENPDDIRGHYVLGLVLFDEGEQALRGAEDQEQARAHFRDSAASLRRALELKPDHASASIQLGRTLIRLGERREALAAFRQAVLCRPEWADGHLLLGEALAEDGQDKEALRELELAVQCARPDENRPREALDRFRSRKKNAG